MINALRNAAKIQYERPKFAGVPLGNLLWRAANELEKKQQIEGDKTMYRIIQKKDNFLCEVEIQDGTERWTETTVEEAKKRVKKSMKFLNNTDIKKKSIPVYREEFIQTVRLILT